MWNPLWNRYEKGKLKFAAAMFVAAIPSAVVLLLLYSAVGSREPWIWYFAGYLFYTILVFGYAYVDDNSTLFSKTDFRTKSRLAFVHLSYLLSLLLVVQIAEFTKPYLPPSAVFENREGMSWFQIVVFAALAIVFFVEESWLAAKKKGVWPGT